MSAISRCPSQNNSEFNSFLSNLEQLLRDINKCKRTVSVITVEFNARSSSWWSEDINTSEETKLYSLTSSNWFSQLINVTTHIQRSSSSCIDLAFTDQPNLSVNSGAHASLHETVIFKLYILNLILIFIWNYVIQGIRNRQIQKKIGKP